MKYIFDIVAFTIIFRFIADVSISAIALWINSRKKITKKSNNTEISPYIRDNPYRVDERELDIDWELMRNKPVVLKTIGDYKHQKKYPSSDIFPWEHNTLDALEHDENVSSLGEDIPFEELNNNQKLLE